MNIMIIHIKQNIFYKSKEKGGKNMMRNQKGITLIALVITIIVLLILAGVSIAMLTGDSGILTQASKSSVNTAIGNAKDAVSLKASESVSNYYEATYVSDTTATTSYATVVAAAYGGGVTATSDGVTIDGNGSDQITITYNKDTSKTAVGNFDDKGNLTWTDNY